MARILMDFVDGIWVEKEENPFLPLLRRRHDVVFADYPDYLVFMHEGERHKLYPCTKIFYTHENYLPDWRWCDFAITSRKVEDPRTFHLPVYSFYCGPEELIRPDDVDYRAMLKGKERFCAFLSGYINRSVRVRTRFFHKLHPLKHVDSAGTVLRTVDYNVTGKAGRQDWLRRYKFYMAFENSEVPGWTTERIVDAFASHTVPVYWGDPTITEQFNPAAFIHRRDFPSDEACIEHILKVDADDELYLKYLTASPFHNNRPNKEWDYERLLDFFDRIFMTPPNPAVRRRWLWRLTKWRLAKRIKTHRERGVPSSEERFRQRQAKA